MVEKTKGEKTEIKNESLIIENEKQLQFLI